MPNIDELFKRRHRGREIIILCVLCVGIAGSNSALGSNFGHALKRIGGEPPKFGEATAFLETP